jgi:hypothetical protein
MEESIKVEKEINKRRRKKRRRKWGGEVRGGFVRGDEGKEGCPAETLWRRKRRERVRGEKTKETQTP